MSQSNFDWLAFAQTLKAEGKTPEEIAEIVAEMTPRTTSSDNSNRTQFKAQAKNGKYPNAPLKTGSEGLYCGSWIADDEHGVIRTEGKDAHIVTASTVPILPSRILENIQTGNQTVELAHGLALEKRVIVPRSTVSITNKIVMLSDKGIPVNSDNARNLMRYLQDCIDSNIGDQLYPRRSKSKMGWLKLNGKPLNDSENGGWMFAPYCQGIECDRATDDGVKSIYTALSKPEGKFDEWRDYVKDLRDRDIVIRLALDASLASVLIEVCNALPFVFHIWGYTGRGKTVVELIAASVWGDPAPESGLVRSMKNTPAYTTAMAEFLNNIPFFGDELQTLARKHNFDFDGFIYDLCEGSKKGRLNSDATMQASGSWSNAFIFTGEQPILNSASRAGAQNRTIELELTHKLFGESDPTEAASVVNFVRSHYGTAGRKFIAGLQSIGKDAVLEIYKACLDRLNDVCDATGKQSTHGALLMLADFYAEQFIWEDGDVLEAEQIAPFLKTETEMDIARAAFDAVNSIIAENSECFLAPSENDARRSEVWGKMDVPINGKRIVKFIAKRLETELRQQGYEFNAVKRAWAERGWIQTGKSGNSDHAVSRPARIGRGGTVNCVYIVQDYTDE